MNLKLVFDPILIGGVEIPNRIARTAHHTGLTVAGKWDAFIAYHAERAKGGCGLTILEGASVHPSNLHEAQVYDDSFIPHYHGLMKAVQPYGMKIMQQLWFGGNIGRGPGAAPPFAVSTRPGYFGFVVSPMNEADIEELVAAFGKAAGRCREAGLDGVEVHASHGYIFHQFLSTAYNNRTDRYGGSLENRARLLKEVLIAVRQHAGPGFAVGARFSTSSSPGCVTEEDNRAVIGALQADGLLDFVDASYGDYYRLDSMVGGMHNPTGYELQSSAQLTSVATVPRIVAGRFRTLDDVEQALRENVADLVSMVRAQIADPYLVRKSRRGNAVAVRPCISCNQGCLAGANRDRLLGCTVNASVGKESILNDDPIPESTSPRRVLVVGGGPAGMEAARVAAEAGHQVTLVEAQSRLGGAVNAAMRAPFMRNLGDITQWLERELYRLSVNVQLGTHLAANEVGQFNADTIIVATGSQPRLDGFQPLNPGEPAKGCEQSHVLSSNELLLGNAPIGRQQLY